MSNLEYKLIGKTLKKEENGAEFEMYIKDAVLAQNVNAFILNGDYVLTIGEAYRLNLLDD